jgi:hypothetical protein
MINENKKLFELLVSLCGTRLRLLELGMRYRMLCIIYHYWQIQHDLGGVSGGAVFDTIRFKL